MNTYSNSNLPSLQSYSLILTLLMEQLAIWLTQQKTLGKPLVIPQGERSEGAVGGLCIPLPSGEGKRVREQPGIIKLEIMELFPYLKFILSSTEKMI